MITMLLNVITRSLIYRQKLSRECYIYLIITTHTYQKRLKQRRVKLEQVSESKAQSAFIGQSRRHPPMYDTAICEQHAQY